MIKFDKLQGQTIGILGLARSGKAALKPLLSSNIKVIAWDDSEEILNQIKEEFHDQSENLLITPIEEEIWSRANAFLVSPGIPMYYPAEHKLYKLAKSNNIPLHCDIEFLYQQMMNTKARFIGITGTNGKSTTTALINHVLKCTNVNSEIGGNIGAPVMALNSLDRGYYVLELSSFQLDLLEKTRFDIAVCLTINPDHLDRYDTFERYVAAKKRIFDNQEAGDFAIISIDNHTTTKIMNETIAKKKAAVIPISKDKQIDGGIGVIDGILYDDYKSKKQYDVSNINSLMGQHNGENMAAAFASCVAAGIEPDNVIHSFKSYKSLPHRMDLFHTFNNINFINDSKATNADSTYWALQTFDNIYWIAGGISKDYGVKLLKPFFEKITHAYLIGAAAESFASVLVKHDVPYTIATTLVNAVSIIKSQNIESGNVLLSPACSSFDQWKDYQERGDTFIKLVQSIWHK